MDRVPQAFFNQSTITRRRKPDQRTGRGCHCETASGEPRAVSRERRRYFFGRGWSAKNFQIFSLMPASVAHQWVRPGTST